MPAFGHNCPLLAQVGCPTCALYCFLSDHVADLYCRWRDGWGERGEWYLLVVGRNWSARKLPNGWHWVPGSSNCWVILLDIEKMYLFHIAHSLSILMCIEGPFTLVPFCVHIQELIHVFGFCSLMLWFNLQMTAIFVSLSLLPVGTCYIYVRGTSTFWLIGTLVCRINCEVKKIRGLGLFICQSRFWFINWFKLVKGIAVIA